MSVISVKCNACNYISGGTAPENRCVSGASDIWVETDLLEERSWYYNSSGYHLSSAAMVAAYFEMCASRGWNGDGKHSIACAIERASRIYSAMKQEQKQSVTLVGVPSLDRCPACAKDCLALHSDCCFKFRCGKGRFKARGVPLLKSVVGHDLTFDSDTGALSNLEMTRFRQYRVTRGVPQKGVPNDTKCSTLRALSEQKASSRKYAITGVSFNVCRHSVANDATGLVVDTPGEGLEYALFAIFKVLHMSGQIPLVPVFGEVPDPPRPPTGIFYSDMPCQLTPHLRKYFPEVLKHCVIVLGAVHKYSHTCQLENSGSYHPHSALSNGEWVEAYWSKLTGLAWNIQGCAQETFHERLSVATNLENSKSIGSTPGLFSRMASRATDKHYLAHSKLEKAVQGIFSSTGVVVDLNTIREWKVALLGSGSSARGAASLSIRGQLCAALDQRASYLPLRDALSRVLASTGHQSRQEELIAVEKQISRLNILINKLHLKDRSGRGDPTTSERDEVRVHKIRHLESEIEELKATLHALDGSFRRGHNHFYMVHGHEKASQRKKRERVKLRIKFLEKQLDAELALRTSIAAGGAMTEPTFGLVPSAVPTLMKLEAVDAFEMLHRSAEELVLQLPKEKRSYIETCNNQSAGLSTKAFDFDRDAAEDGRLPLQAAILRGKATFMREQAATRRSWAERAMTVALPPLESLSHFSSAACLFGASWHSFREAPHPVSPLQPGALATLALLRQPLTSTPPPPPPPGTQGDTSTGDLWRVRQVALPNAVGRDGAGGATMSADEGGAASVARGAQDYGGPSDPSGEGFHSQAIRGAIGGFLASDNSAGTGRFHGTAAVAQQALLSVLRLPLTVAEQAMVDAAWDHNDESENVVCSLPVGAGGSSVAILGKHFGRMRDAWLFDESVNAYMYLLQERDKERARLHDGAKRSHFMSSFFFAKVWP